MMVICKLHHKYQIFDYTKFLGCVELLIVYNFIRLIKFYRC